MSLAFLTKPIGGKKGDAPDKEPKQGKQAGAPGPLRGGASNVTVGGAPRVDLMPPEIRTKRSQLRVRRSLRLVLVGVFVVVLVACGATWALSAVAQTSLSAAQAQQQQLVAQQGQYSDVTGVQTSIALIKAGQRVGDSTEIDWQAYLDKLQATLPSGVSLTNVTVDMATPIKAYGTSTVPLQGDRIATLTFSATSPSLPSIPVWLDGLATLPGFADATPGDVSLSGSSYTANVTMHINTEAFLNRYAAKTPAPTASSTAAATAGGH
jgi:outer membrane biogenesis lipoprotein LolB